VREESSRLLDRLRPVFGAAIILSGACALVSYFFNYPIPEWPLKLYSLIVAGAFVGACWSLGDYILTWLDARLESDPELRFWVLPFAVGTLTLSAVVVLVGWLTPSSLKTEMQVLTFVLMFVSLTRAQRFSSRIISFCNSVRGNLSGPGVLLIGAALIVTLLSCFSPITYYDSLVYHLALPARYLMDGRVHTIPFNLYSAFPAAFEMLLIPLMAVLGRVPADYAVNLLAFAFSVSTVLLITRWSQLMMGEKAARYAGFFWWTMPAALFLSVGGYVDVPLSFFITLSLYSFCVWLRRTELTVWLFMSGLFGSMAASIKYTGGLTLLILAGAYLVVSMARKNRSAKDLAYFLAGAAFPLSIWLIKNTVELGNPVFPFLYRIFGGRVGWAPETAAGYFRMLTEYGETSHLFKQLMSIWWLLSTNSLKFGGGMDVLGDFGWGLLVFLAVGALYFWKGERDVLFLWIYALVHSLVWASTKPVLRFLFGIAPILIILSSFTFCRLASAKNGLRILGYTFLIPLIFSNIFIFALVTSDLQSLSVAIGHDTREGFLDRRLTFYSAYEYLDQNATALSPVLVIGEQRVYHLSVPYQTSNLFAPSEVALVCNVGRPEALALYFKKQGLSSVLINEHEIKRLGGPRSLGFTPEGWAILMSFIDGKTTLVYNQKEVEIHKIETSAS
jgi:hypothetical protein